jgi:hypothetical protein
VRWQFDGRDAYPLGYAMECRSLEPQGLPQRDLLAGQPLERREAMLDFVTIVAEVKGLDGVLQECRKKKSMVPLYRHHQTAAAKQKDSTEVKRLARLMRLLKLPEQPAG